MQIAVTTVRAMLTLAMVASAGCSRLTRLGISGESEDDPVLEPGDTPQPAARAPSTIASAPTELFDWSSPFMGDMDGDGIGDFMLPTMDKTGLVGPGAPYHNYLFYGRKDFPELISTADADATFAGAQIRGNALGDVDGDDLADIAVAYETGIDIVFGDRARWSGTHPQYSLGIPWRFDRQQSDGSTQFANAIQRIGDVDGDGYGEFLVTVVTRFLETELPNPSEVATDYLIAGRADGWPSGDWDPSWAIAEFGGVLQPNWHWRRQLEVVGSGDLDGDGYVDIVAIAGEPLRTWVFYGSASGLIGTLTEDRASAEITWTPTVDPRSAHASPLPNVLSDVDGDGTSDLGAVRGSELSIVYGSPARWSGIVELTPDLTVSSPKGPITGSFSADIDGDSFSELIVHTDEGQPPFPDETLTGPKSGVYAVRATTMHATGLHELEDSELYRPAGSETLGVLDSSFVLDVGDDVDGDGSYDLITLSGIQTESPDPINVVYLMPGLPRAPD